MSNNFMMHNDNIIDYNTESKRNNQAVAGTNLKVVTDHWFTPGAGMPTICMVLCKDVVTNEFKAYVGSNTTDIAKIAAYGAKVSTKTAKSVFGSFDCYR